MDKPKVIRYTNGEVTVVWKPDLCQHSKRCWQELGSVFKPKEKPWVDMTGASSERIMEQVTRCPSGALTYYLNHEEASNDELEHIET